jgi:pyruvate dehydrogenase E2 component (dihydrolipoamide acetyltransferase)
MAWEIVLPQWGMEMQDGTIVRWLKMEGDPVEEGEPIVEVETAKIQTELESTASGILAHIVAPEGAIVPIRGLLAVIAAPGEEVPRPAAAVAPATQVRPNPIQRVVSGVSGSAPSNAATVEALSASGDGIKVQVVPAARRLAEQNGVDLTQVQGTGPRGRVLIEDVEKAIQSSVQTALPPSTDGVKVQVVPAARRLAKESGVDLGQVQGSGPGGRILVVDVEKAVQAPSQAAPLLVPMQGMRRTIATRMLQSLQTMAQVTITTEANLSEATVLRKGLSRHLSEGSISPMHLVIKATAHALKEHPRLNALQADEQVQLVDQVNIGVAVALDEGLLTPVIRDADTRNLAEIASQGRELAARTREGKAKPEDVSGGTFTITNLGAYEIDAFTPIINPPQVGILGVGRVVEKPIIDQGVATKGDMMVLSLTFDHRVVDGAPAAEFLQKVKRLLEDPWWMVS